MCEAVLIRKWKERLPPEHAPVYLFHWKHTTTPTSSGFNRLTANLDLFIDFIDIKIHP